MADDKYLRKLDEIKSRENAKEEAKYRKKATLLKSPKEKYKQAYKSHEKYLDEDILKAQYLLKLGEPLYEPPNPHNTIPKNEALVIANYLMSKKGSVAFLGAKLCPGFLYLANLTSLEEKIKGADLIITGEGKLDKQTLMGKAVYEISKLASGYKKKVIVVCGDFDETINWKEYNMNDILKIVPQGVSIKESIKNPANFIVKAISDNCKLFKYC